MWVVAIDPTLPTEFAEFKPLTPFATLQEVVCEKTYAGIGIAIKNDNGSMKVAGVINGSPADKAGIKTDDTITQIDNRSLEGLKTEEVVEQIRGAAELSR